MSTLSATTTAGQAADTTPWLHGVEGVTLDAESHLYWRGTHVGYQYIQLERDIRTLAENCGRLQAAGLEVNPRTVEYAGDYLAMAAAVPNGKQWALALQQAFWHCAQHPTGALALHFWTKPPGAFSGEAVVSTWYCEAGGEPELLAGDFSDSRVSSGASHRFREAGYAAQNFADSAEQLIGKMNAMGFTPQGFVEVVAQAQAQHDQCLRQWRRALVPRCAP